HRHSNDDDGDSSGSGDNLTDPGRFRDDDGGDRSWNVSRRGRSRDDDSCFFGGRRRAAPPGGGARGRRQWVSEREEGGVPSRQPRSAPGARGERE
ncbi:unnamed protein product, partial [Ectocarpus sp. 12 AP-2014]